MLQRTWFVAVLVVVAGCSGGSKHSVEKVTGTVLCDGKPVPNVRVYFAPLSNGKNRLDVGRSGQGNARDNGTFVVSTYGTDDGAIVGKHEVMVSTPHPEDFPNFNCDCETNGNQAVGQVEVKAGVVNDFEIVLPPKVAKNKPSIRAKDLEDIRPAG